MEKGWLKGDIITDDIPIHSCLNNISDLFDKIELAAGPKKNLQYLFK